ncbi:tryptophan halogenase family protein [Saccharobesus litoralis]|nr:tryptophan halogenase family protein [Saccharobesus litoralis]
MVKSLVIVGGGTAGWLTAGILAAQFQSRIQAGQLSITLCESANVPTVGVGEGTWPTMVTTLKAMGISETDFLRHCEVSFKQGSKFVNWGTESGDFYYHPFDIPNGAFEGLCPTYWLNTASGTAYAQQFSSQFDICEAGLAPKTITTPEYANYAHYGYHLNAGAFSTFLQKHCIAKLGVRHCVDDVTDVTLATNGNIESISLKEYGVLAADLFVDCTGFKSLLLGKALNVEFVDVNDVLFADTALAAQVAYPTDDAPIKSYTQSTAQDAGWIWDIGLPTRRGVGHVFSSQHMDEDKAIKTLEHYIKQSGGTFDPDTIRKISFRAGHRKHFWHKNCVAIGLSAGFLEPLEASALVLVELSANMLAEQLPNTQADMPIRAQRFNDKFAYRWSRAIEFLKLHYVLSERQSAFWQDNRAAESIPSRLQDLLTLWQHDVPKLTDFDATGELFQAASYQFVLYGSSYRSKLLQNVEASHMQYIEQQLQQNQLKTQQLLSTLPSNRELLNKVQKFGFAKI